MEADEDDTISEKTLKDEHNYSLLRHNTFGIDARCQRYIEFASTDEAIRTVNIIHESHTPYLIIGAGSNLLLTSDYEGLVVRSAIRGISLTETGDGQARLTCGSGERWDDVVAWTVGMGYSDLVNLSLIPGDVGASAVQNIGAYGAEVCQSIDEIMAVEIPSGRRVTIDKRDCAYDYRDSSFKGEWKNRFLITHVTYRLSRDTRLNLEYGNIRQELQRRGIERPTPLQLRDTIIDIRRSKLPDPEVTGNAGSFFKNPIVARAKYEQLAARWPQMPHYTVDDEHEKIPAGWMIEQCGWKGRRMGRAAVHERQALVLVNSGDASGQEIVALCQAVCKDVLERFGIELQPEVNMVGAGC